eukprot:jgi/Mesen1/3487/ME000195S02631
MLNTAAAAQEEREAHAAAVSVEERIQKSEARLREAEHETERLAESLCAVKKHLAEREQQMAQLEADTSGELARLGSALEAVRGEYARLEEQQAVEKQAWEATAAKLKKKVEAAEKARKLNEAVSLATKNALLAEVESEKQAAGGLQEQLAAATAQASPGTHRLLSLSLAPKSCLAMESIRLTLQGVEEASQVDRLSQELAAYKVRAHALLQKKQAKLTAAVNADQAAAQEKLLEEARSKVEAAEAARDEAVDALHSALADRQAMLAARDSAVLEADLTVRGVSTKLETARAQMSVQAQEWQARLSEASASWRGSC